MGYSFPCSLQLYGVATLPCPLLGALPARSGKDQLLVPPFPLLPSILWGFSSSSKELRSDSMAGACSQVVVDTRT